MAIILEHAPVLFKCTRCAALCESLVDLLEHREDCQPMPAAPLASKDDAPTVALDLTHRPARPMVSRARRRVAGEIELAPSEAVGQAGRRVTR